MVLGASMTTVSRCTMDSPSTSAVNFTAQACAIRIAQRHLAFLLRCATRMDTTQRVALAKRLEAVEAAVTELDGSPAARTRYRLARKAYREAE